MNHYSQWRTGNFRRRPGSFRRETWERHAVRGESALSSPFGTRGRSGIIFTFVRPAEMTPETLYDKLWESHAVHVEEDGTTLLYIDRHLVHEVTSPQAFEGIKLARRKPWRVSANLAVADHNVPTTDRSG